jgi:signal transduction histidine kinase
LLTKTGQLRTREMQNASEVQVHVNRESTGAWRLKDIWMRATRMVTLALWPESVSTIEWVSASIVHDLRNPIAAIYTAAELLMDSDPAPGQVKRLAANIIRSVGRMRELLSDLHCVVGGNRATTEMCDIGELIAEASEAASAATENDSVRVLIDAPERIELPLIRRRMERVFFNLIANALEAMPLGGKLQIACRKAKDYVLIELEDTGPGIPSSIRDRLFEPFVTAGKREGVGLGLALSRQTVRNHGGDIWTEPSTGARFVVRLPPVSRVSSSQISGRENPNCWARRMTRIH